jgi:uncharacterized protein YdhG (YjbR/CyaY superfamily)
VTLNAALVTALLITTLLITAACRVSPECECMTSNETTVAGYIRWAPVERRAALKKLRALFRKTLKGYREGIAYGGPVYFKNGVPEVGFGSQKRYIAVYLKPDVVEAYRAGLKGLSVGKTCIRYPSPEKIDFDLVRRMLQDNAKSDSGI